MADLQELNTKSWYAWEERGRGWKVYGIPVELEPPLELFILPSVSQEYMDDGRTRDSLGGMIMKGIGALFKNKPKPEPKEEPGYYSYPDNPVPFEGESTLCCYRISLPKGSTVDVPDAVNVLYHLSYSAAPLSFETIGVMDGIVIQWTCRKDDSDTLVSQLRAHFPLLAMEEVEAGLLPFHDNTPIAIGDLGLQDEFMLPLGSVSTFSPDPLIGIIAALENLSYGESGMLQVLFQGTSNPWAKVIMSAVSDGGGGSFFEDAPTLPKIAQQKTETLLYGVVVRVIGQGTDKERSRQIFSSLANAVITNTRSEYNSLMVLPNGGYPFERHLECVYERTSYRLGMMLNAHELVNLVHIPSASVVSGKLSRQAVKSKPLPKALSDGYYAIGTNVHLSEESTVWLDDRQLLRHMHIIGATGTGKSTFIANLFLQDCDAGNGCIVFDPHGDLIDDIIPRIGEERLGDVILIDPSDTKYPIGFNLLEAKTELEKIILSSDLVDTFKEQSTAWGDTMTAVLTNAINAFLESSRGGTLLELRKFLLDPKFRQTVLNTVEDPAIRSYWQHEYPQLKKGSLSPLLTRLDTFLRPKVVRNMMAQKEGLDFNEVLAENKIVLVKLSQGLIGRGNSYLLGTLLLAKVYQAAQARQGLSKDERSPYYVYIDEFHNFLTPTLADILSGARKYGLGLVLAHQQLSQIRDSEIGSSVLSNPGIRVCFRVGYSDAQQLEKGFAYFDHNDLQNLGIGEAIGRVERNDWDFNMYTDDLPTSIYNEGNLEEIRHQTRNLYATPASEVEAIVHELYQYEPPQPKPKEEKPERKVKEPGPFVEPEQNLRPAPEPEPATEDAPVISLPKPEGIQDLGEAAKKFVEKAEKERQEREHTYIQQFVKKMAEQRGFKAQLEAPTPGGGRVDVLIFRDTLSIAVEVSVTNTIGYEVQNLQKCIEAGYGHIVMLCDSHTHLRNIKGQATEVLPPDMLEKIQFLSQDTLHLFLDTFTIPPTQEKRNRGYRVKTSYVSPTDADVEHTLKGILANSLKRSKKD